MFTMSRIVNYRHNKSCFILVYMHSTLLFLNIYLNLFLSISENRPSVEMLEEFLDRNRKWIIPKLFEGASPEFVAHSLAGKIYLN